MTELDQNNTTAVIENPATQVITVQDFQAMMSSVMDRMEKMQKRMDAQEKELQKARQGAGTASGDQPMVVARYAAEDVVVSLEETVATLVTGLFQFTHQHNQGNVRLATHNLESVLLGLVQREEDTPPPPTLANAAKSNALAVA